MPALRPSPSAAERAVQQEVQRCKVGQLEPLDLAVDARPEVGLDALGRDRLAKEGEVRRVARDEAHVDGVALVAGAAEAEVEQKRHIRGRGTGSGHRGRSAERASYGAPSRSGFPSGQAV